MSTVVLEGGNVRIWGDNSTVSALVEIGDSVRDMNKDRKGRIVGIAPYGNFVEIVWEDAPDGLNRGYARFGQMVFNRSIQAWIVDPVAFGEVV